MSFKGINAEFCRTKESGAQGTPVIDLKQFNDQH